MKKLLLALLLFAAPAFAGGTDSDPINTLPSATQSSSSYSRMREFLRDEDADRFNEMFNDFVVSGGLHSTAAGLTATVPEVIAYAGGYRIDQGDTQITYDDDTTCWVIAHRLITGNLGSFVRVSGTHLLSYCGATQPALPTDAVWLMEVTTAGGAITDVGDIRSSTPIAGDGPEVDARDFGVKCTGTSDDTAGLKKAIDSVAGSAPSPTTDEQPGVGSVILVPPGQCKISSALRLDDVAYNQNITIRGHGPLATVIRTVNSAGANVLEVVGGANASIHGFRLEGLTLEGNFASGRCLYLEKTIRNVALRDVALRNCGGGGAYIYNTSNRMVFDNVRVENDDTGAYTALDVAGIELQTNAEQVWMYGVSVRGFHTGIHVGGYNNGFGLWGGDIAKNRLGVLISGADAGDGHVSTVTIEGNYFEQNGYDVEVTNAGSTYHAKNIHVRNNTFSQTCGKDDPYDCVDNTGDALTGTVCQIEFNRVKSGSITGNEFRKTTSTDVDCSIQLASASKNIVLANNFWPAEGETDSNQAGFSKVTNAGVGNTGQFVDTFSLSDYYPTGDGTADDSTEIQALFDDANAMSNTATGRIKVIIPEGNYGVGAELLVKSNLEVESLGVLTGISGLTNGVVTIKGADNVVWRGGTIDAAGEAGNNAFTINGKTSQNGAAVGILVENIVATNAVSGGTAPGSIGSNGGKCLSVQDGSQYITVNNARLDTCDIGIAIEGIGTDGDNRSVKLSNISVKDAVYEGIRFWGSVSGSDGGAEHFVVQTNNLTFDGCSEDNLYCQYGTNDDTACTTNGDCTGSGTCEQAFGCINGIAAGHVQMRNTNIRSTGEITALKGNFRHSDIEFTVNAAPLRHLLDFRINDGAHGGFSNSPSRHNRFRVNFTDDGTTEGYLAIWRADQAAARNVLDIVGTIWDGASSFLSTTWAGTLFGSQDATTATTITSTYPLLSKWSYYNASSGIQTIQEGAGAPSSTPSFLTELYRDTSTSPDDIYIAVGTASSSDWEKITP